MRTEQESREILKRHAIKSLFKHLKLEGFSIKELEPYHLEDYEDLLEIKEDTPFETIMEHYFTYDEDYILSVEKDGVKFRVLQTWWGGVEGLWSDYSWERLGHPKAVQIREDIDRASDKWYDEMQEKEIDF